MEIAEQRAAWCCSAGGRERQLACCSGGARSTRCAEVRRIDGRSPPQVVLLSAAKFHSAAVSLEGKLYTWGWGRGGRLGALASGQASGWGCCAVRKLSVLLFAALRWPGAALRSKPPSQVLRLCPVSSRPPCLHQPEHPHAALLLDPCTGHPEAHIHSGESAVIAPRLVASLGRRAVAAVAAAKHHTVFCTTAGEVGGRDGPAGDLVASWSGARGTPARWRVESRSTGGQPALQGLPGSVQKGGRGGRLASQGSRAIC